MTRQSLSAWCLVIGAAWLAPAGAVGQTQAAAPDGWTASRTAWGDPDLQGVWSFATITPLERPERYAGRDRLTDTEITTLNQDALTRYLEDHPEMAGGVVAEEPGLGALAWAATDAVNTRLEEVSAVHDARRAEQLALVRRYRFLSPALLAQEVLVDAAGTGDARFARFQSQVRAFAKQCGSSSCRRSWPTSGWPPTCCPTCPGFGSWTRNPPTSPAGRQFR